MEILWGKILLTLSVTWKHNLKHGSLDRQGSPGIVYLQKTFLRENSWKRTHFEGRGMGNDSCKSVFRPTKIWFFKDEMHVLMRTDDRVPDWRKLEQGSRKLEGSWKEVGN